MVQVGATNHADADARSWQGFLFATRERLERHPWAASNHLLEIAQRLLFRGECRVVQHTRQAHLLS